MAGREVRSCGEEEVSREEDAWATAVELESQTDDSDEDPTFDILEGTPSKLSKMSLSKSRPRSSKKIRSRSEDERLDLEVVEIPQLNPKEEKCFEKVEQMIKDGQLDKLKIDECKIYLRKYALRLTGNKDVLQARIKEHLEVMEGDGEKKYPVSSFRLNCKGDACMGDVVMFEQNVYDMFSIVSRSATGPPCGTRTVAGRIVKESYGVAKQQHTFTIEVLWSKGERPLPPLHPLLIKGRNLYRLKTMRQRWVDEEQREKVLQEKHRRGCIARCSRDTRILEKEMKMARGKSIKELKISSNLSVKESCGALAQNTRNRAHESGKPIAAGAQNTEHQVLVYKKPASAKGHENGIRHQKPEKGNDITQYKQNSSSAMHSDKPLGNLHSPPRWGLPSRERMNCLHQIAPIIHGEPIDCKENRSKFHRKHEVNIGNALDQNTHHQNAVIRSEKPIQSDSVYHAGPETHDERSQVKLQDCSTLSNLGSPQRRFQFHSSHRWYGFPDRKPLRNLNSSSVLGSPPHGDRLHSNYQDGNGDARHPRNLSSPSRLSRLLPGQPCRFYLQGRCWYGHSCKYLHEIQRCTNDKPGNYI